MYLLLLSLVLGFSSTSFASEDTHKWSIGAGLGIAIPQNFSPFKGAANEDIAGGVWVRRAISQSFSLQLDYDKSTFADVDSHNDDIGVMGLYRFSQSRLAPYLGVGVGYSTWNKLTGADDLKKASIKSELGADWWLKSNLALNMAVKHLYVDTGETAVNEASVFIPRVGITYGFGNSKSESKSSVVAAAAPAEKDMDGDDDGILDADDKCLNSLSGAKVNSFGCSEKEKASIKINVQFQTGKAIIDQNYAGDVSSLADFMNKFPTTKVVIEGHTDNTGGRAANVRISEARAKAVMNELVKTHRIDAGRLSTKGYGPDQPIADNTTVEGRASNRRVVAEISE